MTETEAKAKGLKVGVAKFPWAASGRAIGIGRTEGFTKLIFDEETHRVIGGAIVGVHAGDLLAEIGLAIEMGAEAEDIGHTIHAHPTLSESVGMAAEVYDGTITDLYIPKKSDATLHDRAATYGTVAAVLTRRMEVAVWWGAICVPNCRRCCSANWPSATVLPSRRGGATGHMRARWPSR